MGEHSARMWQRVFLQRVLNEPRFTKRKCPKCGNVIVVPTHQPVYVGGSQVSSEIKCKKCQTVIKPRPRRS